VLALPQPFDWVGILGTGQSLSVGAMGVPVINDTQPFHNLKLLDMGPDPKYPIDGGGIFSLVPLVEPIRPRLAGYIEAGTDSGQYPDNIRGETPHSAMANQLSALFMGQAQQDYVTLHTVVGWGGKCINRLNKSGGYLAYPASLAEGRRFVDMAKAAGKTFGYGAIILTHGECDTANTKYEDDLYQLWADYDVDLRKLTGQTTTIPLLVSQQSTLPRGPGVSASALAVWKAGVDHPGKIVCVGPKYQYAYAADLLHLNAAGYVRLGEKYAQVYHQVVVLGKSWKPLQPASVRRASSKITVDFEVPVPPLEWDPNMKSPHQALNTAWANGKGFEVQDSTGPLRIQKVALAGSSVEIDLDAAPTGTNLIVRYAMTQDAIVYAGGTPDGHIGLLRDSDSFVGRDAETIACHVTQGSATLTSVAPNGFSRRSPLDDLAGQGLPASTIIATKTSDSQVTLSQPWSGATGTADITVHHDQRNYAVHFELPVP
jgi:hypothetical protein